MLPIILYETCAATTKVCHSANTNVRVAPKQHRRPSFFLEIIVQIRISKRLSIYSLSPQPCSVRNIDRLNIDRMPGGNTQFELRKPREVNISVWAYSPDKSLMVGPLTEENNTAMLPDVIGSFDIQMEIPAQ